MSPTQTLSGVVSNVVFHKAATGFAVLKVAIEGKKEAVTVIGETDAARPGNILRAEGSWRDDPSWGQQFRATRITLLPPSSEESLKSFLASGAIKGVGPSMARRLVDRFGAGVVRIIEDEPQRLREVAGVGAKTARRIAEGWKHERHSRDILLFLHEQGVRPSQARRIIEAYGDKALPKIMSDPYLLAQDVRGIGFASADALAHRLGISGAAPVRRIAALREALRRASEDGHSAQTVEAACAPAAVLLGLASGDLLAVVEQAVRGSRIVRTRLEDDDYLQLEELARAERGIAQRLASLLEQPAPPPVSGADWRRRVEESLGFALSAEQEAAVRAALGSRIAVISGGPGTGKTTLVRAVCEAYADAGEGMALAAPTGRAARRLATATGREAQTLHRLLEADPARGFGRHAGRPLDCRMLVVDEVSMVDLVLMNGLLQALPDEAQLLLVGDADQLAPVGPGQVLRDLIKSRLVPVLQLRTIFRQAAKSAIVRNAHRVVAGEAPIFEKSDATDCFGVRATTAEDALAKILELVTERIPRRFGLDPLEDAQVVVPVNRGPLGTRRLNEALQAALNPRPEARIERRESSFGVGDKVMQTENDHNREVFNGDIGRIVTIDRRARTLEVAFEPKPGARTTAQGSTERRLVAYGFDALDQLVLAYAVTVHKAQGSEYPAIVLVLMSEHGRMLRRRLLYTAITRARSLLVIVTDGGALEKAVLTAEPPRLTLLPARLNEARAAAETKDR